MKLLVYTFRTFPYISELEKYFDSVLILDKLKVDLEQIKERILTERPDKILGIAKSNTDYSTIEKYTINKFHKAWKVADSEIQEFNLDIPTNVVFKVREKATHSYCNYSMFSLKLFLHQNNLNIPLTFVHITKDDIRKLSRLF